MKRENKNIWRKSFIVFGFVSEVLCFMLAGIFLILGIKLFSLINFILGLTLAVAVGKCIGDQAVEDWKYGK